MATITTGYSSFGSLESSTEPSQVSGFKTHVERWDQDDVPTEEPTQFNQEWRLEAKCFDPAFREHAKKRLDMLRRLDADWDGFGAPAINRRVLEAAANWLGRLPDTLLAPRPEVVPLSNGSIQFEWDLDQRSLEIEFESSGRIHYLKWAPSEGIEEEGQYPIADTKRSVGLLRWLQGGDDG